MILALMSLAFAAPIDEAEARALALRFYGLTGRPPAEEVFLADDVAALVETGREAAELTQAVEWIARNVPGASRYTLAGILESHLAQALGEEEELLLPPPPTEVLAAPPPPERFEPSAAFIADLLRAYYEGVGRPVPDPPREADLQAIAALSRAGWNEAGLRQLVAWVPANVHGAETLGFAEAAAMARTDKGYLGGPRSDGELETLRGLSTRTPPEPLFGERDPYAFDGGPLAAYTTLNALPSPLDLDPSRLAGSTLRHVELDTRFGAATSTSLLVGQASARWGFALEGGVQDHVPGLRESDRFGVDGAMPLASAAPKERATYARFSLGSAGVVPLGVRVWGVDGDTARGLGAATSLRLGAARPLSVVLSTGAVALVGELEALGTESTQVYGELGPTWRSGDWFAEGQLRVGYASGGLLDDGGDIRNDNLSEAQLRALARAGMRTERTSWALGLAVDGYTRNLDWEVNDGRVVTPYVVEASGGAMELFAGARYGVRRNLWLSGGARAVAGWGDATAIEGEAALGVSWLVLEKAWLNAGFRGGVGPEGTLSVAVPL